MSAQTLDHHFTRATPVGRVTDPPVTAPRCPKGHRAEPFRSHPVPVTGGGPRVMLPG
jgi:hypothetical protein